MDGDNFQQSSVTCKSAQVVGSEMKIDPRALPIPVEIISKKKNIDVYFANGDLSLNIPLSSSILKEARAVAKCREVFAPC